MQMARFGILALALCVGAGGCATRRVCQTRVCQTRVCQTPCRTWAPPTVVAQEPAAPDTESQQEAPVSTTIRIALESVPVDDQDKALRFYTEVLGFEKKRDVPAGGGRWLTVVSPAGVHGVELMLEPLGLPAAKTYQEALYADGVPVTMFFTDDIEGEYERLRAKGVRFTSPPTTMEGVTAAIFDDTCGNLIMLAQE